MARRCWVELVVLSVEVEEKRAEAREARVNRRELASSSSDPTQTQRD